MSVLAFWLVALAIGFAVSQLSAFTTTIYLHRGLAHRALTGFHPILRFGSRFVMWITTGMKPREWAAIHRWHHATTDTPDDPHSPIVLGYRYVQLCNVFLYRKAAKNKEMIRKYSRDLPADKLDKLLFDHAWIGLPIGIGLLAGITTILGFGPWLGLLAASSHAVIYVMLSGAINGAGHWFGKRPYENSATNEQWLAWITAGEGLHNNHHAAPTSATFALNKGDVDPAWPFIRVFSKWHLLKIRHLEPHFQQAAERSPK